MQQFAWTTPAELLRYYAVEIKSWGLEQEIYRGPINDWHNPGIAETVGLLWERTGYKGLINKVILLSFPLIVLTMVWDVYRRLRTETSAFFFAFVHGIFIVNFLVWLILAPQFRFILPAYIFYGTWVVWRWMNPLMGIDGARMQVLPYISIALLFLVSAYPLDLEVKSTSTHIGKIDSFSFETAVKPHVSYSFPGMNTLVVGGAEYYHVEDNAYCWDSPLPCMSVYYQGFLQDIGYRLERKEREEFRLERRLLQ